MDTAGHRPAQAPFGLLLLSGFMARLHHASRREQYRGARARDVLRPWIGPDDDQLDAEFAWEALETSVVAVLDVRFGSVALRHPASSRH